ncbi:Piso0_001471 [Millerozyma farinosa CBS 7064]|uniref:chitinase n=1 Tax=Pichia sorbitophila (strain ATCC MYA-4447 / BCRC 22081 / CBS 7064 / NBRC 10061 / NRRL Y-12695) TaxID=559304 RepID=G8YKW0_PICSO|nr:Piso0_001471 [Millerozyma farinosa CBS 7064]
MLMQKQFRFAQLLLLLTHAATILAQGKVAVYWGQASGGSQKSLGDYCTDDVDIVILSFLNNFPSPWTLDFSSSCSEKFSNGVLHCSQIGSDIKKCQQKGKKVLLSLGGQNGKQGFSSDSEATDFAQTLWNAFGGGSSKERPFDDAKIDGFDFDVENKQQTGYVALAKKLKDYYSQDSSKKYYLSASPQCVYPDESVGDVLSHVPIDFAFIQFYNNNCNLDKSFNFDTWQKYAESAPNKDIELFIGLPGSSSAAGSGYVSTDVVKSTVQKVSNDKNFAGISLWDASAATSNTGSQGTSYLSEIKDILGSSSSPSSSGSSSSGSQAAQSSAEPSVQPSAQPSGQYSSASSEQASSSLIPHQSIAQQGTESSSSAATVAGYNAAATAGTTFAAGGYASTPANQGASTSTNNNNNVYGSQAAPQSNTIAGGSHQAVADDSVVEAKKDSIAPAPSSQQFKSYSNSSSSTTSQSSKSVGATTGANDGNKMNAESVTSQGSAATDDASQQSASVSESVSSDSTLTTTLRKTIMKAPFSNSTTNNGAHAAQTADTKPTSEANNNKNSYHYSAMVVGPSSNANSGSNKGQSGSNSGHSGSSGNQSGSNGNQSGSSSNSTIPQSGSSNGQDNANQGSDSGSNGDTTTTIYSTISTTITSKSSSNTAAPSSFHAESVTSQLNSTANATSSSSSAMSSGFVSLSSYAPSSTSANAQQKREVKGVAMNSEAKASLTTVSWFSLLCLVVTSLF